ncbi:MAG: hypothetical protein ABSG68_19650 [Thermoguttaceae bacterium]
MIGEFVELSPPDVPEADWRADLEDISARLAECCRRVDPNSTDKALEQVAEEGGEEAAPD